MRRDIPTSAREIPEGVELHPCLLTDIRKSWKDDESAFGIKPTQKQIDTMYKALEDVIVISYVDHPAHMKAYIQQEIAKGIKELHCG